MKHLLAVTGQANSGPGERQEMLDRAHEFLSGTGVATADLVRIDVPVRGGGDSEGPMRGDLEAMIPLLQSGSLFGDLPGLLLVDVQNLNPGQSFDYTFTTPGEYFYNDCTSPRTTGKVVVYAP